MVSPLLTHPHSRTHRHVLTLMHTQARVHIHTHGHAFALTHTQAHAHTHTHTQSVTWGWLGLPLEKVTGVGGCMKDPQGAGGGGQRVSGAMGATRVTREQPG